LAEFTPRHRNEIAAHRAMAQSDKGALNHLRRRCKKITIIIGEKTIPLGVMDAG